MKIYSMIGTNTEVIDSTPTGVCPAGHVEMHTRRPGMGYVAQADGSWLESESELDRAKAQKLVEMNAACDALLDAAVYAYPESEIRTFERQTAEAKAYLADSSAHVPMLSRIAAARGISLDALADRVLEKAAYADEVAGELIGHRQALADRLAACGSVDAVNALEAGLSLPDAAFAVQPKLFSSAEVPAAPEAVRAPASAPVMAASAPVNASGGDSMLDEGLSVATKPRRRLYTGA